MSTAIDTLLVSTPGNCGGRIRIDGTRITVHRIATLHNQGLSPEEIVVTYPHLNLAQVYAALAYYHSNRVEIDAELAADDRLYDQLKQEEEERRAQQSAARSK
jgi:uncharacterized protein (DUF433 family)